MAGVNKVILIGNLGKDPEVRYMPNGTAVANITLATSESWKDKQTGENKEITEWHRVTFFRRLAEIAGEYLRKGSKVYVEGKIQTRKWTDQAGVDRYSTDIIADQLQMLDSKGGASSSANSPQQNAYQPNNSQQSNYSKPANSAPQQQPYNQQGNSFPQDTSQNNMDDGFLDEDIPF